MDFDFIRANWMIVGLTVASGGLLLASFFEGKRGITPAEATLLINRESATVIDVRSFAEYEAGHITGARHIPMDQIANKLAQLEDLKNEALLVVCQSGLRSTAACKQFKQAGFTRISNLDGGMNAWTEAKLPTKKGRKA